MSTAAGNVTVVLSASTTSFSAAMTEAQRNLDRFSGKAKNAGHSTVSGMQAASASIRLIDNPLGTNIRAIERLISQSRILSGVLKAAFPLVGAVAIGVMIARLGAEVVKFIDTTRKVPAALKLGFDSIHLSAVSSADALRLTNDELQNNILKLQGKPQNNLAIAIDEARIKADDLAKSLENDASKVKALLEQNKISGLGGLLTGQAGTSGVTGTVNFGLNELRQLGNVNRQAVSAHGADSPEARAAQKNLSDKQSYYSKWAASQLFIRDNPQYQGPNDMDMAGDQAGNRNILTGFQGVLADSQDDQAEKNRNASLTTQNKDEEAKKAARTAAAEAARKATELRKQAAAEMVKGFEVSAAYAKMQLDYQEKIAKTIHEYSSDQFKSSGLNTSDNQNLNDQGKAAAEYVTQLRASIDTNKLNADVIADSALKMAVATGQISKLDAAQAAANIHTQQYIDLCKKLDDELAAVNSDPTLSPLQRQARTSQINTQLSVAGTDRGIQVSQDSEATNPQGTLASTGFTSALDDFVISTRDAAGQMKEITDNTLSTLNAEFLKGLSGQRTQFGNAGASIFRNVAGQGIQKAEGSLLSLIGFGSAGKIGTQGNPMWTRSADGLKSAVGSAGSFISSLFGGSKGPGQAGLNAALSVSKSGGAIGTIGSDLTSLIPGFANGGSVAAGTLAMIGEKGPELAYFGSSAQITPNHKLSSVIGSSGGDTHHWNIDARNSSDPAQTAAMVQRAIRQAAPQIMAGTLHAANERQRRRPRS